MRIGDRFRWNTAASSEWRAKVAAALSRFKTTTIRALPGRDSRRRGAPAFGRAKPRPWHPGWLVALRIGGFTLACATIFVLASIIYFAFEIPIGGGVANDTASALVVDAADGSELAVRGTVQGEALTADEISPNLKKAIVAIEDRRFYDHGALDPHGMARALFHDIWNSHAQGASTITQQLARLMVLSSERTLRRKVQEALVAIWLEHHLTKPEILARYLDSAYFGAGAYGADAAAERYFGTSARTLTLAQAAMIAGLVRAPSALAPHRNLEGAQARAKTVLQAMAETGAVTKAEAAAAIAHPAVLKVLPETPPGPGYVSDAAAEDVKALVGTGAIDLTARTTIDAQIQAAAEKAVTAHLAADGPRKHASQAALVALGANGEILAMVGGRDYAQSSFNRATQAKRQPGSLFKLFVYLTALRDGATPDTMVEDRPVTIGAGATAWQPHDFEDRYEGRMRLSTAFARSINTVAAQLGQQVGIKAVIKTAHELGVQSDLPDVPSLTLGTANVSLMEMTRAYATIAADQDTLDPYLVQRIASHGKVLFNRPPQYGAESDPSAAKVAMRELLADVVREGTGKGARLPFATSGKTGTTQDFRDAWFIGSAPDITIGVWVGNDDDSPMKGETGGDLPVKIWRDVAVAAEARLARTSAQAEAVPPAAPAPKVAAAPPPPPADDDVADDAASDAEPADAGPAADGGAPAPIDPAAPGAISGEAEVVDTSTLGIEGHEIRLAGVAPLGGRPARRLARYLRRRDVTCASTAGGGFRCSVDGDDLATTILANGGSEATQDAPPDLAAAQDAARASHRGIWRRGR